MKTVLLLLLVGMFHLSGTDSTLVSKRPDGRQVSTYAIVRDMLKQTEPACEYKPGMSKKEFRKWQKEVSASMAELMKHPDVKGQPAPVMVSSAKRDGYTLQRWESYPLPGAVSPFLVMIPDGVDAAHPAPAILCIPGSGVPKESLACEPDVKTPDKPRTFNPKYAMGLDYVKEGYIAVCVDNAATGEAADQEKGWENDDVLPSRFLLELGWSWLGYTSFFDMKVLQWMKTQPYMRQDRLVVSGFSLGTEPMMVLGALDKDIYAFVYNDFLCQTQERAIVETAIDKNGFRHFPNSIRHLIPDYWHSFNFIDVVASFAPRHLIFVEGGLDRDFDLVKDAYRTAGAPEAVKCIHYAKFQDPAPRNRVLPVEDGIDNMTFLGMANVDPRNHYFKYEYVLPWLKEIL